MSSQLDFQPPSSPVKDYYNSWKNEIKKANEEERLFDPYLKDKIALYDNIFKPMMDFLILFYDAEFGGVENDRHINRNVVSE